MLFYCSVNRLCTAKQPDTVWSRWVTAPCFSPGCSYIHDYFGAQGHHGAEMAALSHAPTTSSSLAGGSASLNSVFLELVKIAPGCSKCPWGSQSWKLPGQSNLHWGQRGDDNWILLCGTVVKRRRRESTLAMVKTPGLSMQAIHPVASEKVVFWQQLWGYKELWQSPKWLLAALVVLWLLG